MVRVVNYSLSESLFDVIEGQSLCGVLTQESVNAKRGVITGCQVIHFGLIVIFFLVLSHFELERERGPMVDLGTDFDLSALHLGQNHLGNGESNAHAAPIDLLMFGDLPEELEKFLDVFLSDADASVRDFGLQHLSGGTEVYFDSDAALESELGRVTD